MAGRHRRQFDEELAARLAYNGSSNHEISEILGISDHTLKTHCRKLLAKSRAQRRHDLRMWQTETAKAGNPALQIWLGKNELGQSDKHEPPVTRVIVEYADRGIDDRDPDEAAPGSEDDPA